MSILQDWLKILLLDGETKEVEEIVGAYRRLRESIEAKMGLQFDEAEDLSNKQVLSENKTLSGNGMQWDDDYY